MREPRFPPGQDDLGLPDWLVIVAAATVGLGLFVEFLTVVWMGTR